MRRADLRAGMHVALAPSYKGGEPSEAYVLDTQPWEENEAWRFRLREYRDNTHRYQLASGGAGVAVAVRAKNWWAPDVVLCNLILGPYEEVHAAWIEALRAKEREQEETRRRIAAVQARRDAVARKLSTLLGRDVELEPAPGQRVMLRLSDVEALCSAVDTIGRRTP